MRTRNLFGSSVTTSISGGRLMACGRSVISTSPGFVTQLRSTGTSSMAGVSARKSDARPRTRTVTLAGISLLVMTRSFDMATSEIGAVRIFSRTRSRRGAETTNHITQASNKASSLSPRFLMRARQTDR